MAIVRSGEGEGGGGGEGEGGGEGSIGLRDGSDDEIVQLEAEIALRRERVAASLGELRRRVHGATSWRHWANTHPIAWIGVGLFLGFMTGYGGRDRRRGE